MAALYECGTRSVSLQSVLIIQALSALPQFLLCDCVTMITIPIVFVSRSSLLDRSYPAWYGPAAVTIQGRTP